MDRKGVRSSDCSADWIFQMPLFTVQFRGDLDTGTDFWVAMGPTERSILIRSGINDQRFVPVLAFIHNERWHYA